VIAGWRRLQPGELDHERLWMLVGIAATGVLLALRMGASLPPVVCPFKLLTGWPCVGCGTTRAFVALADGAVGTAVRLNPLVTLAAGAWLAWAGYAGIVLLGDFPRLRPALSRGTQRRAAWTVLATVVATWIFLMADGR
jgi:hypothetical protein